MSSCCQLGYKARPIPKAGQKIIPILRFCIGCFCLRNDFEFVLALELLMNFNVNLVQIRDSLIFQILGKSVTPSLFKEL